MFQHATKNREKNQVWQSCTTAERERILDFPNKFFCCWKTTTTNGSRARDSFGYTGNGQAKRISFVVFLNAPRTHQEQQQQQNNVPDCNGGDGHGRLLRSWPHWLLGRKYLRPSVDPFVERTWKMYRKKKQNKNPVSPQNEPSHTFRVAGDALHKKTYNFSYSTDPICVLIIDPNETRFFHAQKRGRRCCLGGSKHPSRDSRAWVYR